MENITYLVPNISCGHCAHTIKMELIELEGVKSVDVDVQNKEVHVTFSPPLTTELIETTLAEINYPADKSV